jgi:hypothetical protein
MTAYDDARQAPPYDVPYWFEEEAVNVTDVGPIVTPAYYWTQLEPNGPVLEAPDLATLQRKCEDAAGLFVELYPEDED